MKQTKFMLALALLCCFTMLVGCSSWMPDDPYQQAKATPRLEIPEGLQQPSTDATLTTEIESGTLVEGGHRPPAAPKTLDQEPTTDTVKKEDK